MLKDHQLFLNALNKTGQSELCFNLHPLILCKTSRNANLKKHLFLSVPVLNKKYFPDIPQALLLTAKQLPANGKSLACLDHKE